MSDRVLRSRKKVIDYNETKKSRFSTSSILEYAESNGLSEKDFPIEKFSTIKKKDVQDKINEINLNKIIEKDTKK